MDWNEKLQIILDYVEDHLQRKEEPIDASEIAKISGCSFGFFQKVFSYMNGISFSEYVRSRKLTLAGYDLKSTNKKVIDISFQYGYDSPTSFTKAFQQFHGISPKEARSRDAKLQILPKMQITFQQQYTWRLEQKPAFRLIGKSTLITNAKSSFEEIIPAFWSDCQKNGIFSQLYSMDTGYPQGMFGYFNESSSGTEYSIMVISDKLLPQGFQEITIPNATWAVFDCLGPVPQAIQRGWHYLQEEWLVKYPFSHAPYPELEWYSTGNSYGKDYLSQIWIPVLEEI